MAFRAVTFDNAAKERIQRAAAFEKKLRLESFLNSAVDLGVCHVRHITGNDMLEFEYAENKLFSQDEYPHETDFAQFFGKLQPKNSKLKPHVFIKRALLGLKFNPSVHRAVKDFVKRTFLDAPKTAGYTAVNAFDSSIWLSPMVDAMAHEYGWSYEEIMEKPLASNLNLLQYILKRKLGKEYAISNSITNSAKAKEIKILEERWKEEQQNG